MTEKQILELMEKHFHLAPIHDNNCIDWFGGTNDFMKFARAIYEEGYDDGVNSVKEGMV